MKFAREYQERQSVPPPPPVEDPSVSAAKKEEKAIVEPVKMTILQSILGKFES